MVALRLRGRAEEWKPEGVNELEPNALQVVFSTENRSVIAGPGAGKTELLAQRAAYLLQEKGASDPRRILAISFKRDAAANLADRVKQRCHHNYSERFDSMTFDAFAKGLLDRFGQALPEHWRPHPDYEITFPKDRDYSELLYRQIGVPPASIGTLADIQAISVKDFIRHHLFGLPLPVEGWPQPTPAQWATERFWKLSLHERGKSFLSFPMIGRLAELVLRFNPMVRKALQLTYSYLFMDEFQDTTQTQYDLIRAIFRDSCTVITAVGDNKQQIMRWALAMEDPFTIFDEEFGAIRTRLYNNYRSSPDLVRIQHVLAQALDAQVVVPVPMVRGAIADASCVIWEFSTPTSEAEYLASFVATTMKTHSLRPRDFVLLVRQKAKEYAAILEPKFVAEGLLLRNEAREIGEVVLQELLVEPVSELIMAVLHLATATRAGQQWAECQEMLTRIRGNNPTDEIAQTKLARELDAFVLAIRTKYPEPPKSKDEACAIIADILDFVGYNNVVAAHPAYGQGGWFEKVLDASAEHLLVSSCGVTEWAIALDVYEGVYAIPLMTIHKSKGLEYHTVIFVGLDDSAWWSFSQDKIEATAGFFVAFTRAKQRVVFSYCAQRGAREEIASLYQLLKMAGVDNIKIS